MNSNFKNRLKEVVLQRTNDENRVAPFFPTSVKTCNEMLELLEANENDILYDIGSGDGRMLFEAVTNFNVMKAVGVEFDEHLVEYSKKKANELQDDLSNRIQIIKDDCRNIDYTEATIITCYMGEYGTSLVRDILHELPSTIKIVNLDYSFDDWDYEKKLDTFSRVPTVDGKERKIIHPYTLYLYRGQGGYSNNDNNNDDDDNNNNKTER
eukprot:TRINITY_DN49_c2_g1_i1.p1 TRINITY_DN49_c2_g1~~TRINITY_DN49_c2_g1_i1.p1  ORF type:complete len:210 (+),score=65.51 TRINITY_DN49_c2_g1_i1:145-774(+)